VDSGVVTLAMSGKCPINWRAQIVHRPDSVGPFGNDAQIGRS